MESETNAPRSISGVEGGYIGGMDAPRREKYWRELTDAEKIERMRGMVLDLQRSLQMAHRMLAQFGRHQHSPVGEMLVEYDRYGSDCVGEGPRRRDDDVYF